MADTAKIPVVLKVAQIYQDAFNGVPAATVAETYDNPGHPLHGFPYVWDVLVQITSTEHSDLSTLTPFYYNAKDISAGMWLADNTYRCYKIIELIDSAADGSPNYKRIRIKDVGMYTALSEPTNGNQANDNTPEYGNNDQNFAYIFTLSEDGLPNFGTGVIESPANIQFIDNITARFQYRNLLTANYNNSDSPNSNYINYEVGQMVYLDSSGIFQVLDASNAAEVKKRFGVITSVNVPEDGDLGVRPWGKVVGDLDLSAFTVGDALYYDDTAPSPYLTSTEPASSAIPMYIKISDTVGMYITDMVGGGGGDQIYISQVADGTPTPEDVGGIDAGTLPENIGDGTYTLSEVIDQLLWPAICPTINGPEVTLSDNVGNLQIIGESLNITFTTGANGGSISGGQGVAAGDLTNATLAGAGSTNETLSITPPYDIADYTLNGYTVVSGTQSWTLTGTFAVGPMPVDNLGGNCPDVQYSGGSDTASVNFEGVYPVYSGNSTQYQGAASGTWASASVNTTYWTQLSLFSFNSSAYFQWDQNYDEDGVAPDVVRHRFVIPAALTVTDIEQYSTASSSYGSIGTSGFTQNNVTLDLFGNSVNYVVWEKNVSPGGSAQYRVYFS